MSVNGEPLPIDPRDLSEQYASPFDVYASVRVPEGSSIPEDAVEVTNKTLEGLALFDAWAHGNHDLDGQNEHRVAEQTVQMISLVNTLWDLHTVQFRPPFAPPAWEEGQGYVHTLMEVFQRSAFGGIAPEAVPTVTPALLESGKLGFRYQDIEGSTVEVSVDGLKERVWEHAVNQIASIQQLVGPQQNRGEQMITSAEEFAILQSTLQLALHDGSKPLSGIHGGFTTIKEALTDPDVLPDMVEWLQEDGKERIRVGVATLPHIADLIRYTIETTIVAEQIPAATFREEVQASLTLVETRLQEAFKARNIPYPGFILTVGEIPSEVSALLYSGALLRNLVRENMVDNIVDGFIKKVEQWPQRYPEAPELLRDWKPEVAVQFVLKEFDGAPFVDMEVADNGGGVGQQIDESRKFSIGVTDKGEGTSIAGTGHGIGMARIDALSRVLGAKLIPKNWWVQKETTEMVTEDVDGIMTTQPQKVRRVVGGASITLRLPVVP